MHRDSSAPDQDARHRTNRVDDLTRCATAAEDAIRQLARLTIDRPSMTPADVDGVLAHLAEIVAALPQVAAQLGDILNRARETHELIMDSMSRTYDPDIALDTARLHLDAARILAVTLYGRLNAAREETAHICATPHPDPEEDAELPVAPTSSRPRSYVQPLPGPSGPAPCGPVR